MFGDDAASRHDLVLRTSMRDDQRAAAPQSWRIDAVIRLRSKLSFVMGLFGEHEALDLGERTIDQRLLLLLVQVRVTHGW